MPEFATPFNCKKSDRKFTHEELIRAIRFSLASEFEAIQLYEEIVESINNDDAIKLLQEIIEDEKVHAGNFLHLMKIIAPEEIGTYMNGCDEAKEILGK